MSLQRPHIFPTMFCTSYFQALFYLVNLVYNQRLSMWMAIKEVLFPLTHVVVFNIAWLFVFSVFKDMKRVQEENRPQPSDV